MFVLQQSVRVNIDEIIDTSLVYLRVIAMQLTNPGMIVEKVFKHELAPIPTSIFNDNIDLRPAKSKAELKRILESKASNRTMNKSELTIIDGSAILWVVSWQTKASVIDYLQNLSSYILQSLETCNIDLQCKYSIKSSTRSGCGKSTCRTHKLIPTSLQYKFTTLGSSENKWQLIELICDHLLSICCIQMHYSLIVTRSSVIPRQIHNGLIIERTDLSTTHEEANVIIVQQAYQFFLDVGIKSI